MWILPFKKLRDFSPQPIGSIAKMGLKPEANRFGGPKPTGDLWEKMGTSNVSDMC